MPTFAGESAAFHTTRWTLVRRAQQPCPDGRQALADLCAAYYQPVVTFLGYELRDAGAARDMGHAFFAKILEGDRIHAANPLGGRFRSYLLGAVKHFLAHSREANSKLKRGAGLTFLTLEDPAVIGLADPQLSPDAAFERQWAITVLGRSLEALRAQYEAEGRDLLFTQAQPHLNGDAAHGSQETAAAACGLSLPAFRMALSRLRGRLQKCVRQEVAGTLASAEMVDEEMLSLFAALSL